MSALYRDGYSHVWLDLERLKSNQEQHKRDLAAIQGCDESKHQAILRLQKENAALKQTLEFTVSDASESRETLAFLKQQNEGLRTDLERLKGLLDTFLFEGSSSGRRYGQIWKRREELRKEHGLD
jgi:chromosome segregation ATPase